MKIQRARSGRKVALGIVALTILSGIVGHSARPSSQAPVRSAPSVVGSVVDAAGFPLPGVVATALPQRGGDTRAALTRADGTYQFEDLPDSTYRIDFELPGFDMMRRNLITVRRGEAARVDATLPVGAICECTDSWARLGLSKPRLVAHLGQVVNESGRPLPHARLEIIGPVGREAVYATREGRFQVRLSPGQAWQLTARDSGFGSVTVNVSGDQPSPLVIELPVGDQGNLPTAERLTRPCCPGELLASLGP
jgi:hypothetical protein